MRGTQREAVVGASGIAEVKRALFGETDAAVKLVDGRLVMPRALVRDGREPLDPLVLRARGTSVEGM